VQQAVQCGRWNTHRGIAVGAQRRRELHLRERQGKEDGVEVAEVLERESAAPEQVEESLARIAPQMARNVVVRPPHPFVCRHGGQEQAAGLEPRLQCAERARIVLDVLQHVERGDQVEASSGEGERIRQPAGLYGPDAARGCPRARGFVELHGEELAVPGEEREVAAIAAAHFEDRSPGSPPAEVPVEQRLQH